MRLMLHRLRRSTIGFIRRVAKGAFVAVTVLAGGLGSSWYMVEAGSRLTTERIGPWVSWISAARSDADPYTRAHFINAGTLPVSADVQRTYVARTDQAGERLHSSCDYAVEGNLSKAEWWSLAVFDERGRLIPNAAERHAFTGQTAALNNQGGVQVTLSREARSGNWLPTGGAGRLALVLTISDQKLQEAGTTGTVLPSVRKIKCR